MFERTVGTSETPRIDRGKLRAAVEDAFTELALHPAREFHFVSPPLSPHVSDTTTRRSRWYPKRHSRPRSTRSERSRGCCDPVDVSCSRTWS